MRDSYQISGEILVNTSVLGHTVEDGLLHVFLVQHIHPVVVLSMMVLILWVMVRTLYSESSCLMVA